MAWGAVSGESGHSVTREYSEAVAEGKGFFQQNTGKITKAILTTSIGTGVATVLDAHLETAVIASLAASKVVDPLVDLGLDLLDTYVLDGLTKGWTPKLFFDDLERWVDESKAAVQKRPSLTMMKAQSRRKPCSRAATAAAVPANLVAHAA